MIYKVLPPESLNQFHLLYLVNMFFFHCLIFALQLLLVRAIVFDGPCPNVQYDMDPTTIDIRGPLIYSTPVSSTNNHLFYNSASNWDYLEVSLVRHNDQSGMWSIAKWNNGAWKCLILEVLDPIQETGYFRHLVDTKKSYGIRRKVCNNAWDRYQLLQRGDIGIIWGCVNLNQESHEEGLWVIEGNSSITQKQVQAIFPVGSVTFKHMVEAIQKPNDHSILLNHECSQLRCQRNQKITPWQVNASWALLSAICIVGGVFTLYKGLTMLLE